MYLADQDTNGVDELYSVAVSGGSPVKLNGILPASGKVFTFAISRDAKRVIYRASQTSAFLYELFDVPLAGGPNTNLTPMLVTNGNASSFAISPDSSQVLYMADQDTDEVYELYSVALTAPAPTLSVTRTTTNTVAVTWPSPSTGWDLQQNTNSVSSLNWSNVTVVIQDDGTTKTLIVNPPTGNRFYRLHKP